MSTLTSFPLETLPETGAGDTFTRLGGPGSGPGIPDDEMQTVQVAARCIRERWGLTAEQRTRLASDMMELAAHGKPRTRISATKVLVAMAAQDLADLHHLEGSRQQVEVVDRGAELAGAASILGELRRLASAPGGEPARAIAQVEQPGPRADTATGSDSTSPSPQPADDAGAGI